MDERKAAAYYDDMLRRGSGAARSKQGLGYGGTDAPSEPATEGSRFVKGSNHEDSLARYEKENRLATVRDKLKRKPAENDRGRSEKQAGDHSKKMDRSRSRSRSNDSGHRESGRRNDSKRRNRSSSGSSSRDCSASSSEKSSRIRHERSRRSKDRRRSPRHSSRRSRSSSPRRVSSDYHSRKERKVRDRSHSRSRSRSRSPSKRYTSGNRRSRNKSGSQIQNQSRSPSRSRGQRSRSRSRDRSRREGSRSHSPTSGRKGKSETLKKCISYKSKAKVSDYSKLIPGYDDMTPAEKVKAKMKLQLSETVSKDTAKGIDNEWERFDFNKNAPLDDDAKLDYFGDGTGAVDDTTFLHNTGSTLLSSVGQSRREAKIKEAHDNAIFGPSSGISNVFFNSQSVEEPESEISADEFKRDDSSSVNNLLSDQVLGQQEVSWRERALKLKQQRSAGALN